ncbi:MAG TPA: glycosyltransferase [Candidatus Acidoferrales bacterium]|nr:glycosyltransferase [Candidatus Acidoferrales bacterium]
MTAIGNNGVEVIALLGRHDVPTDALEAYCTQLGQALAARSYALKIVRVAWDEQGWFRALGRLRQCTGRDVGSGGVWILVQYTALSWSRRGFPVGFLGVLWALRSCRARCAIVFHDPEPYGGERLIDRLRRAVQFGVMRAAYRWAARSILTVPVDKVSWLPLSPPKAIFIPVGSNIPPPAGTLRIAKQRWLTDGTRTVVVFGVTGGESGAREVDDIAYAVQLAAQRIGHIRLVGVGRGAQEAWPALEKALNGAGVELSILGLLPPDRVAEVLADADALLFVRGYLSSGRSSAIAGIACGVPVVGYAGRATALPVTAAGVLCAAEQDREALGKALGRVLSEPAVWHDLYRLNIEAYERYFSWEAIAARYAAVLTGA